MCREGHEARQLGCISLCCSIEDSQCTMRKTILSLICSFIHSFTCLWKHLNKKQTGHRWDKPVPLGLSPVTRVPHQVCHLLSECPTRSVTHYQSAKVEVSTPPPIPFPLGAPRCHLWGRQRLALALALAAGDIGEQMNGWKAFRLSQSAFQRKGFSNRKFNQPTQNRTSQFKIENKNIF